MKGHSDEIKSGSEELTTNGRTLNPDDGVLNFYIQTLITGCNTLGSYTNTLISHSITLTIYNETLAVNINTLSIYIKTLAPNSRALGSYNETLNRYTQTLASNTDTLSKNSNTLKANSETLGCYIQTLPPNSDTFVVYIQTLNTNSDTLDTKIYKKCKNSSKTGFLSVNEDYRLSVAGKTGKNTKWKLIPRVLIIKRRNEMNLRYSNKLVMYQAVLAIFKDYATLLTRVGEFAGSAEELKTVVEAILAKENQRQGVTAGKTDVKLELEEELITITVAVSAGLYAYGRKNNLADIKSIADVSYSMLDRMKDSDLITRSQQICQTADKVKQALESYGILEGEISKLRIAETKFREALGSREASVAERGSNAVSLKELFAQADEILEHEIDRFAEILGRESREFYNAYFNARKIVDRGHRKEKPVEEVKS